MSDVLSWWVILLTLSNIFACFGLLLWARSKRVAGAAHETLGHAYDGIQELDTPLPRWWLWIFIGTIVFSLVYLALYPGLGNFPGVLGWTSSGQLHQEMARADAEYGPLYAAYAAKPIPELVHDAKALQMGQRLFANNCAQCHGSDARGGVGFPNLTDNDWIWGGDPDTIKTTILAGRNGVMPPFAPAIGGDEGIPLVVAYVQSLSGMQVDADKAAAGKVKFNTICMACHGLDGKGNQTLGAPNLTDDVWLFGNDEASIAEGLRKGRNSKMPAHADILGEQKAHVVAAYVYSLSHR
ncbi:MAG: cytochrome-c oxidase, cbb3-type subunit III [Deltaproteobacteria bacterium]|nr:cytochrome-c oxidase, cbb3-type subunit III [Deltaproteobacteria bacterium]